MDESFKKFNVNFNFKILNSTIDDKKREKVSFNSDLKKFT